MLLLIYLRQPIERGFFCYDISIQYSYHESSIITLVNNLVSYGAPLILILVTNTLTTLTLQLAPPQKKVALSVSKIISISHNHTFLICRIRFQERYSRLFREITLFLFGVFTVQVKQRV